MKTQHKHGEKYIWHTPSTTTRYTTLFPQSQTIALWGPTSTQSLPERHWTPSSPPPSPCCPAASCLRDRAYAEPLAAGELGRLRCVHSTLVPSYMHRLGRLLSQLWTGPADTEHVLLHCPHTQHRIAHDIHSLEDLWPRPVEVSTFLLDSGLVQRPT